MQVEIVSWSDGRLAFTGSMDNPSPLLNAIADVAPISEEHRRMHSFTFSFPSKYKVAVVRAIERFQFAEEGGAG